MWSPSIEAMRRLPTPAQITALSALSSFLREPSFQLTITLFWIGSHTLQISAPKTKRKQMLPRGYRQLCRFLSCCAGNGGSGYELCQPRIFMKSRNWVQQQ